MKHQKLCDKNTTAYFFCTICVCVCCVNVYRYMYLKLLPILVSWQNSNKKARFFLLKKKGRSRVKMTTTQVSFWFKGIQVVRCVCVTYIQRHSKVCVWHVWHVCVKRSFDVWMWICVWHWVAPYLREHKIFHNELGLGPLMIIEYSTFWRICSTSLAFCWTKFIMEMIWFVRLKKVL